MSVISFHKGFTLFIDHGVLEFQITFSLVVNVLFQETFCADEFQVLVMVMGQGLFYKSYFCVFP